MHARPQQGLRAKLDAFAGAQGCYGKVLCNLHQLGLTDGMDTAHTTQALHVLSAVQLPCYT